MSGRPCRELGSKIVNAHISPTGARAVFEARGEIFFRPGREGRRAGFDDGIRPVWRRGPRMVLSQVASRSPTSLTESGEYEMHLRPQNGLGTVTKIPLGDHPAFFI